MRIHFTVTDLARTRLAGEPSPLATTTFSAVRLARGPFRPEIDLWRRAVTAARRNEHQDRQQPMFCELTPLAPAPIPGFLRPHHALRSLDKELERLCATPRAVLQADLAHVAQYRGMPGWADALADGDRDTARELAESVRDFHRVAVGPYWRGLVAWFAADLAFRTRQLRDGGMERVLGSLGPRIRWHPPVLEVVGHGTYDYDLRGRGLLLAPAAFTSYIPCNPEEEQPTLYYEVAAPLQARHPGPSDALAALLGHSRAAVLESVALAEAPGTSGPGLSTGELARRAGLSPPSASEHATVLRRGGLIATERTAGRCHHTLTELGAELLRQAAAAPGTRAAPS
ncbi:ArsR/SmtB family transcription factor [Streptomyces boncukensis]|uniref:Winged helix-turn-helix transcriptional regulator n=1 Tax=Streptomyces boncukensis TaxID=2711219 RepID=A0A6G4WSJ9_9ACTN|nr:winged helix-turn-helix domain-containing protein [Streptomyces boncukensis]NGO68088.1 winged helix-turn-helix transcriptional regulator [Streptomyces boncukensis]